MTRDEWLLTIPKGLVWAELGVFLGDFSKAIFENCQPSHLHLVDIFPTEMTSGDKDGNYLQRRDLSNVPAELTAYFNSNCISIHKSTTSEFLKSKNERDLDIVYIDADHSYESVKRDLEGSFDRIKENGIIAGHDYSLSQFPGVVHAVNEFCKQRGLEIDFLSSDVLPTYVIRVK